MRIIAGEFRGRNLKAPQGMGTRPTTDRVRESLMSSINSLRDGFEDAVVLDAFAGSGALGFESISRGADCAWFFDSSNEAIKIIQGNAALLGLDAKRARVSKADVLKKPFKYVPRPFDLVFLDPPYAYDAKIVLGAVAEWAQLGFLAPDAIVVYEHATEDSQAVDAAMQEAGFEALQSKRYGATMVRMCMRAENS